MRWLIWIVELVIPVTLIVFGALAARKKRERAGSILLASGLFLGVVTYFVEKWRPLPPTVQGMVLLGVQLVACVGIILFVSRNLKDDE